MRSIPERRFRNITSLVLHTIQTPNENAKREWSNAACILQRMPHLEECHIVIQDDSYQSSNPQGFFDGHQAIIWDSFDRTKYNDIITLTYLDYHRYFPRPNL